MPMDTEKYSFVQETIKKDNQDPKKTCVKVAKWMGLGLAFGMAACVGFYALSPWAKNTFQDKPKEVELSQPDETEVSEDTTDVEIELPNMTIAEYRELSQVLKEIADEAKKSVVTVSGIRENETWLDQSENNIIHTAGLILADNGRELLILTNYSTMKDGKIFQVEFVDGSKHQAMLKQKDGNTDFAVFSVAKNGITNETISKIKVAELGNSNGLQLGSTVLAIGQPFGYQNAVSYGVISSLQEQCEAADGLYDVLVTDMVGAVEGSGVVFDTYGKVMGIMNTSLAQKMNSSTLVAYKISGIKTELELMSNGKYVPYIGIVGSAVTEEVSATQGIPTGIYVKEVELDSPAMRAGIKSGDVIVSIDGEKIETLKSYRSFANQLEAGKTIKFEAKRLGSEDYVDITFQVTIGMKE